MLERVEGRSMFDRIDDRGGRATRRRSESPRRSDVRGPTPEGIDRYVPAKDGARAPRRSRSRSPAGARRQGARGGRRPGARREESGRGGGRGRDTDGKPMVGGRPRKTAEELDAEMADYWGSGAAGEVNSAAAAPRSSAATGPTAAPAVSAANDAIDDDIDMIE